MATATKGVDVSKWQGSSINWKKVAAAGIKFAILRAGYGSLTSQKDPTFETNYAGAKAAGLKVGAYWYSYATSTAGAKKEAAACLSCIKGKTFDLPVYFDQEYEKSILALTNATRTSICKTFCEAIKAAGFEPGIYASSSFFRDHLNASELTCYHIWAAQYASKCTCPIPYEAWQYSSTGSVSGISGSVDMDYLYADVSTTTVTTTTTTTKGGFDVSTLSTIKSGSTGPQVKSLQALLNGKNGAGLTVDGIAGAKTVAAIKAYQTAKKLTVDGIAGVNTWTSLLTA